MSTKSAFDDARSPLIANAAGSGNAARDRDMNAAMKRQDRGVNELEAEHQQQRHAGSRYNHPRTAEALSRHQVHQHQRLAEQNDREINTIEAAHAREQQSRQDEQRKFEADLRALEQRRGRGAVR